jgi:hypothetical protein
MTHYQTVFNGARMVHRKVQPKKGGTVATPPVAAPPQPQDAAPAIAAPPTQQDTEAKKKSVRMRVGADLLRLL